MAEMKQSTPQGDIARDVFDIDDVEAKTELRPDQIEKINKLNTLSTVMGSGLLRLHLKDFMVLQKSKDRQGLREFISALKSKKEELIEKGKLFMNNMLG